MNYRQKRFYNKVKAKEITSPAHVDNYNDLKLLTREDLQEFIPEGFEFKTNPWLHQVSAFVACILNKGFLCALDLGTGKTKTVIDVCRCLEFQEKRPLRILVICLKSATGNWLNEVKIHSDMRGTLIEGVKEERFESLAGEGFFIIGFESFSHMMSMKTYNEKKDKNELIPSPQKIHMLDKFHFDALIVDESHKVKNPSSLSFQIINKVSQAIKYKYLLTGTPFGNTLIDVWSQYKLNDGGETFGGSFTQFKRAYFKDVGYWGPKWEVTESGEKAIRSKLFNKAIRYEEAEVQELPDKSFRKLEYKLSDKQRAAYINATNGFHFDGKQVPNKSLAFRQVCSTFEDNGKINALEENLEIIVEKSKVVIFTFFKDSVKLISAMLKKNKIKFVTLDGSTKNPTESVSQFQSDPTVRVIVANIRSGGASINLFAGNYTFYYDIPESVIDYKQSIKRTHRAGQTQKCFYYFMVGEGTIENQMCENMKNGEDAFVRIMDADSFARIVKGEIL